MAFPVTGNEQIPDPESSSSAGLLEDAPEVELAKAGDAAAEALASASVLGADQQMASADEQAENTEEGRDRDVYGITQSGKAGDVRGLEQLKILGLDILPPGLKDEQ